jgi:hypothetical protein
MNQKNNKGNEIHSFSLGRDDLKERKKATSKRKQFNQLFAARWLF